VIASLVYGLSVTTVIFGKHIDKLKSDLEKRIHTLPTILGEKTSRHLVIGMMILPYFLLVFLILNKYFTPVLMMTLLALPRLHQVLPAFLTPRPSERPANFPDRQGGWPLYFAPLAFWYNRSLGTLLLLGLIADGLLRLYLPTFWR
jgi:1,4-dihydroxy-2-naphthoate octaprenyltransferase